jgi:hypothetical protein
MFAYIFNVPVPVLLGTEELCRRWFQDRARGLNLQECGCEGQVVHPASLALSLSGTV